MALWLAKNEPRDYIYVCTPTGNELSPMKAHWRHLEDILGKKLIIPEGTPTLEGLIQIQKALPNFRMRWCTRR